MVLVLYSKPCVRPPAVFFIKVVLGLLCFHINVSISIKVSVKIMTVIIESIYQSGEN